MATRIVILGGGTGGTIVANRLRRALAPGDATITVIDRDDDHLYQPGLLFVPFGLTDPDSLVRPRARQLHRDIAFREAEIDHVDSGACTVHLADGAELPYDVLVVASGARLVPEETEGMTGQGWLERVFPFYTLEGRDGLSPTRCAISAAAASSSTSSTCRSSAPSRRSSSSSSPTGSCARRASATRPSWRS